MSLFQNSFGVCKKATFGAVGGQSPLSALLRGGLRDFFELKGVNFRRHGRRLRRPFWGKRFLLQYFIPIILYPVF
jgi:hypothetical protein